ncbi:hypothetical protein QS306_15420 [Paraburkholderia bonniea]|uniref:hypothetical protein n=1 Tax=Paraburkholderia bonniea TaxID=2152891 RepID=UPI0015805293|nr:hypothetical protein [Paraburkholderia bonniea]WJF92144.1 hypothetical protein QS306_15420 [Paraburkholderia bonniea]WJF95464.1 hypothetical protein QS308_15425 [Paraburkholderia bonniea]
MQKPKRARILNWIVAAVLGAVLFIAGLVMLAREVRATPAMIVKTPDACAGAYAYAAQSVTRSPSYQG